MHEVSIALGMIEEVNRLAREHNAKQVTKIRLKIGMMSGIVTDSLVFAFDVLKPEQPFLKEAVIEIEEVPSCYTCGGCGNSFEAGDHFFPSCPGCGSYAVTVVSGREQDIENVEMEV